MLPISSVIRVLYFLAIYIFVLFCFAPEMRKKYKIWLYTIVFVCLFFPDIEYLNLPFGLKINIQTYAIMICGVELIEMWTKHILGNKKKQGKKLSKKMEKIYESL